jgi:septal ring factor EnvC (AmiA/AmiB activator)
MAEIERRQGRMTYFGAAAVVLAVAAAAAAMFVAVTARNDAATKDDLDEIEQQVQGIQGAVRRATEQQLKGVSETVGSLDQRIEDLKKKQAQDARDITTLQGRVNSLRTSRGAGGGGGGAGGGGAAGGGAGAGGAGGGGAGNLGHGGGVGP